MHIVHLPGILHNGYELSTYVGYCVKWHDVTGDRQAHGQAWLVALRGQELHCVPKKTTLMLHTIDSTHINRFW